MQCFKISNNFQKLKNAWKFCSFTLLDCYSLRFDEKYSENSKYWKNRENESVMCCMILLILWFDEKNYENLKKIVKFLRFYATWLIFIAIWREKFQKFKTQKNSWKYSGQFWYYSLRFDEKNSYLTINLPAAYLHAEVTEVLTLSKAWSATSSDFSSNF